MCAYIKPCILGSCHSWMSPYLSISDQTSQISMLLFYIESSPYYQMFKSPYPLRQISSVKCYSFYEIFHYKSPTPIWRGLFSPLTCDCILYGMNISFNPQLLIFIGQRPQLVYSLHIFLKAISVLSLCCLKLLACRRC